MHWLRNAALTLFVGVSFVGDAAAAETAALVRWRDPVVDARLLGVSERSTEALRFEIEGVERQVEIADVLRFGGRSVARGGTVVALDDGSQLVSQRVVIRSGEVRLQGGLFNQQRVPLERVRSIVRRYPYDENAVDRLQHELQAVEPTSDVILTMSGEMQRVIVPRLGASAEWRMGASDLDVVDLAGDRTIFEAAEIRGIVFGRTPSGPSQAVPAAASLRIGFTDGSYLARAQFAEAGAVRLAGLPEDALVLASWTPDRVCYLASAAGPPAGVTLLSAAGPVRYGAQDLFPAAGPPLLATLLPSPPQPGLNQSLTELPIRVGEDQLPYGLVMHPASTAIFIVPSGAVLLGQLAQLEPQRPGERGEQRSSTSPIPAACRLTIAAGADEATIRTVTQTRWVVNEDDPLPLRVDLGGARILVLSCESNSPEARPVVLDLRIATPRL